jgi:hypothetical protein
MSAHLDAYNISLPTMVIPIMWRIFDFVNCLFDISVHEGVPEVIRRQSENYRNISEQFEKVIKEIQENKKRKL